MNDQSLPTNSMTTLCSVVVVFDVCVFVVNVVVVFDVCVFVVNVFVVFDVCVIVVNVVGGILLFSLGFLLL